MCGIRKEEVFSLLQEARKPVVLKSATERLQQVLVTQNLQTHGNNRIESLDQAKQYYEECLAVSDWSEVVKLTSKYLDAAVKKNNDYLRYLILSILDVLEETEGIGSIDTKPVSRMLEEAFLIKLDFTSSKGLSLKEVYERAGSKDQFMVILKFLSDHPRCNGELREAVDTLMKHYDEIKERKLCA